MSFDGARHGFRFRFRETADCAIQRALAIRRAHVESQAINVAVRFLQFRRRKVLQFFNQSLKCADALLC